MSVFRFRPILKSTLWGGERLIPFKHLDVVQGNVGESWEISGVGGSESVVADGRYAGYTLPQLIDELKGDLVGGDNYRRFGNEFPLLIKFIDARQDLSIQVHPDDATARRQGLPRGKTEMWYIIDATEAAHLYSGLRREITPAEYTRLVESDAICDALAHYRVKAGDVFFLPGGRIHSIGAGCFLAEIQQTSDTTYRIYDFNRRDKDGHLRPLHTQQAAECIDYSVSDDYRTHYPHNDNEGTVLAQCPYFTTSLYRLTEPMTLDYSELDSFVALIVVEGEGTLTTEEGEEMPIRQGETLLLSATTQTVTISGKVKVLETFV